MIPANGFVVFYEVDFGRGPTAFTFNAARGDSAILSQADPLGNLTGYRDEVKFGAAENGVSFGRLVTSVGSDFTALSAHTFGQDAPLTVEQFRTGTGLPNAGPKVGPLVISEILYYSATGGVEQAEDEFLELQNISGNPVPLYDPQHATNTWSLRDAVDFAFSARPHGPTRRSFGARGLPDFRRRAARRLPRQVRRPRRCARAGSVERATGQRQR